MHCSSSGVELSCVEMPVKYLSNLVAHCIIGRVVLKMPLVVCKLITNSQIYRTGRDGEFWFRTYDLPVFFHSCAELIAWQYNC